MLLSVSEILESDNLSESDLRSCISRIYYAIYHHFCTQCSTLFLGEGQHLTRARGHIERFFGHDQLAESCKRCSEQPSESDFPQEVISYANTIYELREERCRADYQNYIHDENGDLINPYSKEDVLSKFSKVFNAIREYDNLPENDRRAFSAWVSFKKKR